MMLKLESQLKDDGAVLYCEGNLVGGDEVAELRNAISELLRVRDRVTLDLGKVGYINSGGLSTLVGLYSTARTSGGSIKYVNLSVPIDFKRRNSLERAA